MGRQVAPHLNRLARTTAHLPTRPSAERSGTVVGPLFRTVTFLRHSPARAYCRCHHDRHSNIAPSAARDRCRRSRTYCRSACGTSRYLGRRFPFEGDVGAVGVFRRATATQGEQRPFGYYRITRLADGRAIGGLGFKGQPNGGCVEIGYGLAPSARGHGYAAEAVIALLTVAADHGPSRVIADTTLENIASQRTLMRAGFRLVRTDVEPHRYEVLLKRGTAT